MTWIFVYTIMTSLIITFVLSVKRYNLLGILRQRDLRKQTYGFRSACLCGTLYRFHGTLDKLDTTHTCNNCGMLILHELKYVPEMDDYMMTVREFIRYEELKMFRELTQ